MSGHRSVEPPDDAVAIAERYRRLERRASVAVALLVGAIAVAALLLLPLWTGILVAVAIVGVLRLPVVRIEGTATLASPASLESVAADFGGPTPPPLAFQWGIADDIDAWSDGSRYVFSYLFGRRSAHMEIEARTDDAGDDERTIELFVTVEDRPWATYEVSIHGRDGETIVDLEWWSDRRFGLRRLPQWFAARRFRERALVAQGYEEVERDVSVGF